MAGVRRSAVPRHVFGIVPRAQCGESVSGRHRKLSGGHRPVQHRQYQYRDRQSGAVRGRRRTGGGRGAAERTDPFVERRQSAAQARKRHHPQPWRRLQPKLRQGPEFHPRLVPHRAEGCAFGARCAGRPQRLLPGHRCGPNRADRCGAAGAVLQPDHPRRRGQHPRSAHEPVQSAGWRSRRLRCPDDLPAAGNCVGQVRVPVGQHLHDRKQSGRRHRARRHHRQLHRRSELAPALQSDRLMAEGRLGRDLGDALLLGHG